MVAPMGVSRSKSLQEDNDFFTDVRIAGRWGFQEASPRRNTSFFFSGDFFK